jgi:hypothetical protein
VSGLHKLDEFRVTSKALSADWLATEYNNQNSPSTFYSTSTIEELPVIETPGCGGAEYQGYCWYKASAFSMSCDDVCDENGGLSCVAGASYTDSDCELNKLFSPYACDAFNCSDASGYNFAPANYNVGINACLSDHSVPAYNCSEVESYGVNIICACE